MDRRGVKIRMRKVSFRGILKQEGVRIYIYIYGEEAAAEFEAKGRSNRVTKEVSNGDIP